MSMVIGRDTNMLYFYKEISLMVFTQSFIAGSETVLAWIHCCFLHV